MTRGSTTQTTASEIILLVDIRNVYLRREKTKFSSGQFPMDKAKVPSNICPHWISCFAHVEFSVSSWF